MVPVQELYEADFQSWVQETISALERQDFARLDIQHLLEELAELGRRLRRRIPRRGGWPFGKEGWLGLVCVSQMRESILLNVRLG